MDAIAQGNARQMDGSTPNSFKATINNRRCAGVRVKRMFTGMTMLWVVLLGIAGCASPPPVADPVATPVSAPATPVSAPAAPVSAPAAPVSAPAAPVSAPAASVSTPVASVSAPVVLPGASAGAGASTTAAIPVETPNDYLIGPQDLLKVEVFGIESLNRSVRVNSRGQIALPLVGLVQAGGRTGEQLAADIAARLAKDYLQNPQVTIFIEEFTSQRATVVGSVKTPGVFPLKGRTTLMQVVASAGGPTSVAAGTVVVLRPGADGTRKMLQYDLVAIRDGEAPDPDVLGEDVVHVETSGVKETAKQIMEFILPFGLFAR